MLFTLHKIALRLRWSLPLAILLALCGLAGTFISLFVDNGRYGQYLEPSLVLILWGMMLFSFLRLFQRIPPPVLPQDDFMTRLGNRIMLGLYTLLAFLVVVVTFVLVWMSSRLILLD